jgi:hypothetical protein
MKTLPSPLPEGWFHSDEAEAARLHEELLRELPPGHLLHAIPVDVVAHREGTDDILCQHQEDRNRFTVIHLSWSMKEEINDKHPWVEDDGDYESFLRYEGRFHVR